MPRKSNAKVVSRSLPEVQAEMTEVDATIAKLRKLLETSMSVIRNTRFQPYIVEDGKRKRNPVLKDLREYESTLRCAQRHLAALRAEEAKIVEQQPEQASQWS